MWSTDHENCPKTAFKGAGTLIWDFSSFFKLQLQFLNDSILTDENQRGT